MNAKHTQQGDRHQVVIDCDTNELLVLAMSVRLANSRPADTVIATYSDQIKASALDHEAYNNAMVSVALTFGALCQRIDGQAAVEDIRNRETA